MRSVQLSLLARWIAERGNGVVWSGVACRCTEAFTLHYRTKREREEQEEEEEGEGEEEEGGGEEEEDVEKKRKASGNNSSHRSWSLLPSRERPYPPV